MPRFQSENDADLILMNGKVITVDKNFTIAQAVAVKGDKILAVGADEEVKPLAGKNTEVIDLQGKPVLPGINDSHIHAALFGGTRPPLALDVSYPAVKSIGDIVRVVAGKVKTGRPGEWVRGVGWDEGYLEECLKDPAKHPSRYDLDAVSPGNPVFLGDYSVHELWVNSKALEIAGINKDTPNPPGGEILKDPVTGEPTGLLRELPAEGLVMKVVPPWSRTQKKEAILAVMRELSSLGITSITEGALGPGGTGYQGGLIDSECISIYNDLLNEGSLTMRVGFLYLFGEYGSCSFDDLQKIVPQLGIHSGFGNEWLRVAGVKIFADGIPTTRTAWMSEEYLTGGHGGLCLPGRTDEERYNELIKMILFAHKHGFQLAIHAVGDKAIEASVDGFIKAEREERRGLRHYVVHGDFITPDCIERAARHKIGVCAQPGIKWTIADFVTGMVGEKRSAWQWPLRALLDAGVNVSGSSDAPVTYPSWTQAVQSAVLRESKATGKVSGPEQKISVEEAIRIYTMGGARQDHMEGVKGSIEPGKLADLCVLDRDILTAEPHGIKDIRNLMTVVGGKVVYNVIG